MNEEIDLSGYWTGREANVIQIRMTERELELKQVPVSFFVKKIAGKG